MIRIEYVIDCKDNETANRVVEQYMPSLDTLIDIDGVSHISATWTVDSTLDVIRADL